MIQGKKTSGRFVSLRGLFLLCLCMVFCLLADMPVEAAETSRDWEYDEDWDDEDWDKDWEYVILEDGTVEITDYNGEETKVVIPGTIEGKSVTSIGDLAFDYCSSLTSITIPSSITSIGSGAFSGCSSLTSIDVAESAQIYASKDGILYDKSCETLICYPRGKQGTIKIPSSVTSIGDLAFGYCSSLTSITIPSSVTSIGSGAFDYCSSLTSITIPSSVTNIGSGAFNGCSSLTSIEIPNSVMSIGEYTFNGCSSLTSIEIPSSVTSIGYYAFSDCSNLTSIEIPSGVTSIEWKAFKGCSSLMSITIPSNVIYIGSGVFSGCGSLTSINVAENSQSYASKDGILYDKSCETLICCPGEKQGAITIPSSVTEIEFDAFSGCSSLTSIEIPSSVTSIGNYAFEDCSSLTSINIPSSVTDIKDYTFSGCSSLTSIGIPSSVTNIGYGAFEACSSLTSIEIPSSVTEIKHDAFSGCSNLTSITIPRSVTSIGDCAFNGCSNLTSIEIPSSVTSIGNYAFSGCSNLTSIELPSSVTNIGYYAFNYCSNLISIDVAEKSQNYASKDGILYNKSCETLICCPSGKQGTITIPSSVTEIWSCAFEGCSSLTSIEIPSGVTNIGAYAFRGCSNLTSIEIPSSVTSIGYWAFKDCSADLTIYGESGSHAEEYAKAEGIQFETITHTHTHAPVIDPAQDPTCTENGKTAGSHCSVCDKIIKAQEHIPATGHHYQPTIQKATTKKNGAIINKCTTCGDIKSTTTIYAASTIKLSKISFTYNGKNQKPTVTIKDSKGNKLPAGSYKVTYPKTSKNVGEYTVTVTLQGNYSGTVKLTYQITPKGTSISKLTAKKKGFTVKWKKQTSQTTGYQIQYSTSSKCKGAKTVTIKKNKTTSKSLAKLKAGKKYYVRIRTYKTVKIDGKSVKIYSGWSKVKSVKTKK